MIRKQIFAACVSVLALAAAASAETITVASYNVQLFNNHFLYHHLTNKAATQPISKELKENPQVKELLDDERLHNDKDNWATAQTITDKGFNPDVIAFEECCGQDDLEYFNKRWLRSAYQTVIVFKTNTEFDQNLAIMLKPGFTVVDRKDQYYLENDSVPNSRGNKLFARGPAFLKIKSPGGYEFWMGVTHMKSRRTEKPNAGEVNDEVERMEQDAPAGETPSKKDARDSLTKEKKVEAAKWRLREAKRTHEILKELRAAGPADVLLMGDMNDDIGMDDAEKELKEDGVMALVTPESDGFSLATAGLAENNDISFGGYWNPKFRSLIDHAVVSAEMKPKIKDVATFKGGLAKIASDHYPLVVKIETPTP